jgi:CRISPR system Cascade subunit CasE
MYLSRLTLDPRHPQARRDLASPYEMHRTLARAFAPSAAEPPVRFLWRHERDGDTPEQAIVLVQAAQAGCWSALHTGGVFCVEADKAVALDSLVQAGRTFSFRLLANPTVARGGRRHALGTSEDRCAWLERQALRHGFRLAGAECNRRERLRIARVRGDAPMTLETALFEGVLACEEPAALRSALLSGIGPGKALGMGMLSLAPLSR